MKWISHLTNLQYLIGFTGSSGFLLLGKTKNYFFTDFRYRGIALELEKKSSLPFTFVQWDEAGMKTLDQLLKKTSLMEFEAQHVTVSELKRLQSKWNQLKWTPLKQTIEIARSLKSADEVKKLKQSQKINEQVLARVKKLFKVGVTELDLAWQIKAIGHEQGADDISFEPIVGFGPHSAIPHHQNTNSKLKKDQVVLIDMGMKLHGYCSDMTRTFFFGKAPAEFVAIYDAVLASQEAGIKAVQSGKSCAEVDKISRKSMGGLAEHFGHSLGHGIGLDVHEHPNLSSKSKDILKKDMIVTVEPGIYLPGKFGVRIEDMGRVTDAGYDNFTQFSKNPFC